MIKADYHLHTVRCRHAMGHMGHYVERAIAAGLHEIGFADHAPVLDDYDPVHRMAWEEFPAYVESIQHLRLDYPQIVIRLGIEADVYPGFARSLEYLKANYPIDYVLCAVHFLDGEPVFRREEIAWDLPSIDTFIRRYFECLTQGVRSGLFDAVAHVDVIKWHFPTHRDFIAGLTSELFEAVHHAKMAIELNTSGLRKKPQETYPSAELLRRGAEADIPLITGSDAHAPEEVAADFDLAFRLLEASGYDPMQTRRHRGFWVMTPVGQACGR